MMIAKGTRRSTWLSSMSNYGSIIEWSVFSL